jgi:cobalt-zinc-cadmium efflux system membrane fusion protein
MLVDPRSESKSPDRSSPPSESRDGDSERTRTRSFRAKDLTYLVVAVVIAAAAYRLLSGPAGHPTSSEPVSGKVQALLRSGEGITVPERSPLRGKIAIAPVAEKDIQRDLVLPAVIESDPARLIKVSPPLAGRVTQLKVALGEQVKAGQPLVVIDSPDLATAYSDYDRAKVLLELALKNRDRQRGLAKIGGAADKDLQQAETDSVTAGAEYQRATAHLKQIGVDPDAANKSRTVTVVAPMDGSVIDLGVAPGTFWNDSTASLMTIADLSSVWVTASMPEKDMSLVSKGQSVDVTFVAYPGEVRHGSVLFVSDVLDADTRRTKVRIAFDNADRRLRPGMFATADFHAPSHTMSVAPTSALVLKDDVSQVFVETAPWTFQARTVDIAFQQGDQVFLAGGVKAGERIVVKGGVLLGD